MNHSYKIKFGVCFLPFSSLSFISCLNLKIIIHRNHDSVLYVCGTWSVILGEEHRL